MSEHAPLWQWDATRVAAATRSAQVSCREVTESVLARIAQQNPRLNAITLDLAESALIRADELDAAQAKGAELGPLHGVPVTIKDNIDVAGQRTPNGMPGLAQHIAPADSPVTANLLAAGAVIVGRTNTPEVSMRATTDNPLYGLTLNPWAEQISAGGSSGGAGSAVAAGMGALAHGNDIGGSVRIPALHNGVVGLKPTQGRVPAYLPSAIAERATMATLMSVQGVLGRSVADVRAGLTVMAGRDVRDPWWVPAPLEGPPVRKRAAVLRTLVGLETDPQVLGAVEVASQALRAAGYDVIDLDEQDTPGLQAAAELGFRLMMADLDHQLTPLLHERGGSPEMLAYWEVMKSIAEPYPVLGDYIDDLARRTTLIRAWLAFLEEYPVLVVPELLGGVLAVGQDVRSAADSAATWRSLTPSIAINLLGLPAALAPTGLDGDAATGVPNGVQLVGSRFREDVTLAAAEAIQDAVGPLTRTLWGRESTA